MFPVALQAPAYKASANVRLARVIARSTSTANTAAEAAAATATVVPIGISLPHKKYPAGSYEQASLTTDTIAESGDTIPYAPNGCVTYAIVGSAAVTDLSLPLVVDATSGYEGKVISSAALDFTGAPTTSQWSIGWPLETGAAGSLIKVLIDIRIIPV